MSPYHSKHTPDSSGTLHQWDNETANCGMGAIANLEGKKSYEIIDYAITSVCNMTHRGAVDADMKTGDGSGILAQIPRPLFAKAAAEFGYSGSADDLAVGVFFLPGDDATGSAQIKSFVEATLAKRNIPFVGWRAAPVNPDELGKLAQDTQPEIAHL
ncbi:glutamate synthase subunit alpha, partial [Akkermansiaceae bacterium]|nr:glutamate synthase subunit alpha [Akkermansiaceae bacterium]